MACTTVTGRGLGSADKKNRGSEHASLSASKLIGPRCVAVGNVTLDGSGNATISLPVLTDKVDPSSSYVVVANDTNISAATAVSANLNAGISTTTLVFKGTAAHVISYAVMKQGLAL